MISFVLFEEEILDENGLPKYMDRLVAHGIGSKIISKDGKYYSKPEYSPNGISYEITPEMLNKYKEQHPTQTKILDIITPIGGFYAGYKTAGVEGETIKHLLGDPQVFQDHPQATDLAFRIGLGIPMGYGLYKAKTFANNVMDMNSIVSERMKKKQ